MRHRPFGQQFSAMAGALLCLAVTVAIVPASGAAQDVMRIAAIVNDEVVSGFDVEQRIKLVIASANMRDTAETRRRLRGQVLQGLVDERLQLQEAQRFNVEATPQDIDRAVAHIAAQNKIDTAQLERALRSRDVPRAVLEERLKAEITWTKLIQRRFSASVQIGDEEIDEILTDLKDNAGKAQHRISEIFLPVSEPAELPQVQREALRLRQQLNEGASFPAMAREFSRGSTANEGGQVGWVRPGQLGPELDAAITDLDVGEISQPVETVGGIYLIRLDDRRRVMASDPLDATLDLRQLMFALPPSATDDDKAAKAAFAEDIRSTIEGCTELEELSGQFGDNTFADLGKLKMRDLPPQIQQQLASVNKDQFSKPIVSPSVVMLLMVCERVEPETQLPEREQIANNLVRQRLTMLAQRYMRDLRRSAVVELR